jgi:RNA polymerase sigma-70 factor (ECF subfamily)
MSLDDATAAQRFSALLGPHMDRLYRLAYRLTGNAADAQDLLQDVLIKLYERERELSSIETLAPWLCRVLYNQFVDDARNQKRRRLKLITLGADQHPEHSDEADAFTVSDGRRQFDISALRNAIASLSIEHRTVLLMHDAEGYKLEEIQQITGVPVGTIKSRLHRGRARLRELLAEDGTF